MKKIIVIGSPGSGKTTLSLKLSKLLDLPVIHLDRLYWKDGWVESAGKEFDAELEAALAGEKWIIDGNYGRTMDIRIKYADCIIFLDYSRLICLYRVIKRVIVNYGKTRPDMGDRCPEKFDFEFLKYVWCFGGASIIKKLEKAKDKNVITIKNDRQLKKFLKEIGDK